jgi:hypothetical protein
VRDQGPETLCAILKEAQTLEALRHPHIIRLFGEMTVCPTLLRLCVQHQLLYYAKPAATSPRPGHELFVVMFPPHRLSNPGRAPR